MVYFSDLAPIKATNKAKQDSQGVKNEENKLYFEEFMKTYRGTGKARFGVTFEEHRAWEYFLTHCVTTDFDLRRGIG